MLANNVHPKIVSERLGHANISITLDRYSHVSQQMQQDAADKLDALIGKKGKNARERRAAEQATQSAERWPIFPLSKEAS